LPVPWYVSPAELPSVQVPKAVRAEAARLPTSRNVMSAVSLSPGFWTLRSKATSHEPLSLMSVLPPPVDRQAVAPFTELLSTSVPSANVLLWLVVWAVKVAKVPAPARAPMAATTPRLRRTFRFRLSFIRLLLDASVRQGMARRQRPHRRHGEQVDPSPEWAHRLAVVRALASEIAQHHVVGHPALREDETLPDGVETQPGVEAGGAVPGVAPQDSDAVLAQKVGHGADQHQPEPVALVGRVDRHAPEVDGGPSRPVRGRLRGEARHRQDRPVVAHGEVEGAGEAVLGEDDRRPGPAVPQDTPAEVVGRFGRYLLDPHRR